MIRRVLAALSVRRFDGLTLAEVIAVASVRRHG